MRLVYDIFQKIETGNLSGDNAANGRVTVDPFWRLRSTNSSYGNSVRGPYRYYTDGSSVEYEVPAVKTIKWNRSRDQDVGTCTVEIYNAWHESNSLEPELAQQLGKPGFFWPLRGKSADSVATWNHSLSTGAYKKDGSWDASFSWSNTLVEDVIIRTYEGYGGKPKDGEYVSIEDNISNGNIVITGVWIVDTITAGSGGIMTLNCRDIGRILLDQIIFPPLVPGGVYPLEYYTEGKSPFDSFWGPKVKTGVSPASSGEVRLSEYDSSAEVLSDTSVTTNYGIEKSLDGDNDSFALSNAFEDTTADGSYVWFEYTVGQDINAISFTPWAGGYECFICVRESDTWQGSERIIPSSAVTYVKKINVPMYAPDGAEQQITVQLKDVNDQSSSSAHYTAQRIRIGFKNLYYSAVADSSGNHYRAGIRDIVAYRTGSNVSPYSTNLSDLPWTYAMDEHPTRGYWVVDDSGTVHGFGDAADYDSTGFGVVPISSYSNNVAVGLAAHPDGNGYWVLDWRGHVWAYGSATDYGELVIDDPYVPLNTQHKAQALDITATHTGNGYWVVYSNGVVKGFGDAENYNSGGYQTTIPTTSVSIYMDAFLKNNYEVGRYRPYNLSLKAVAIASHPTKMGFWVTDGSGQVWAYGACANYGQLQQRVYNKGMSNSFRLEPLDWASAIESTKTGKGYWIVFASGKIAAFGDAVNQGPVDVYEHLRGFEENIAVDPAYFDSTVFRYLIWGISRDPDGSGFWILTAAGEVKHYNAEFWGQPGYHGKTGYRWHKGNWNGDYSEIVKELLLWAGFLYFDSGITSSESPALLGAIESTGIKSDTPISSDKFDKKTVIDAIRELVEVVGYIFFVDPEGGVRVQSPNWWSSGNFDLNGSRIYVEEEGSYTEVESTEEGAVPFIPVIHESVDLLSYSATLSSADKRSELIIGSELPDPKNPGSTQFVRYVPPTALDEVKPGVSSMRGIVRQGIWSSNIFENEEERKIMAELIGVHAWFSQRTGSVSCVGNPCLFIDDQVRLVERNTSETYIHLINSISSTMDLDSGYYTMDIGTNWLGDADQWVLSTESGHGDAYGSSPYISLSERVDSWQASMGRGLTFNGSGSLNSGAFGGSGEFSSASIALLNEPKWGTVSESLYDTGYGDDNDFVSFMLNGNGVEWFMDDNSTFIGTYLSVFASGKKPILIVGLATDEEGIPAPGDGSYESFTEDLIEILDLYSFSKIVVWQDFDEIGYDIDSYIEFYDAVYDAVKDFNDAVEIYGPNVNLADRDDGYDTSYNGVSVDSRDMDLLTDFISDASAFDGLAISGSFSDSDWGSLVEYIKDSVSTEPLLISLRSSTSGPPVNLHESLDLEDIGLWPSSVVFENPFDLDANSWIFEGNLDLSRRVTNASFVVEAMSQPLGNIASLEVYEDDSLILNESFIVGQSISLGSLGSSSEDKSYTFVVRGTPDRVGSGQIKMRFSATNTSDITFSDSIIVVS